MKSFCKIFVKPVTLSVKLLLAVVAVLFSAAGYAQEPVKGLVKGSAGEPLAGAVVHVRGTSVSTMTLSDGTFVINAPADGVLVFSYLGLDPTEVAIGQRTYVEVNMQSDIMLDNLVVTALGIKREQRALGYSVQSVQGADIQTVKGVDVATSLSGKVAGLLVQTSSDFAEAASLSIRGETPLLVIDGVPVENMTLRDLSADDIEDINVLKGATASALYGYKGGSGAIMVTTKKGAEYKGLSVFVNSSTMFNAGYVAIPEKQTMYGRGTNNVYGINDGQSWGTLMDGRILNQWNPKTKEYEDREYLPVGKDNFRNFLEQGYVLNNNVSLVQQGENGSLRSSLSWMQNKGVYPNNTLNKYTYSLGGDMNAGKFHLSSAFTYSKSSSPNYGTNGYKNYDPMYSLLIWSSADYDVRDYKDYWLIKDVQQNNSYATGSLDNPYFIQNEMVRAVDHDIMNASLNMSYEITPWLDLIVRSGVDFYASADRRRIAMGAYTSGGDLFGWGTTGKGYYAQISEKGFSTNNDFILSGNYSWGDFGLEGLAGGSMSYYKAEHLKGETNGGISVPGFYSLKASVNSLKYDTWLKQRRVNSLYGRLAVSWRSMLFAEGTLRNDWSSTLANYDVSYIYPSVSGSFVVSELLPNVSWLDMWKLRGSWTMSKTPADMYAVNDAYTVTNNVWGDLSSGMLGSVIRGNDVRAESAATSEVGTMASFFKGRLSADVTYYEKRMYDFLRNASISSASGYGSNYINIDEEITRKGWEVALRGTPLKTSDWRLDLGFNWSKYARYYTKIDPEFSTQSPWVHEGARVDVLYVSQFQRTEDGQIIHGTNGLPVYSNKNLPYGYSDPDWIWGANMGLQYKNWTLSAAFDGRVGGKITSYTEAYLWNSGSHPDSTTPERLLDVQNPGTKNYVGKGVMVTGGTVTYDEYGRISEDTRTFAPNTTAVTYREYTQSIHRSFAWDGAPTGRELDVLDGTYFKLRELSLTYDIPAKVLKPIRCKDASISFVGQNMWLWAKDFKYSDPDGGVENFSDPSPRFLGFNLKLTF